MSSSLIDWATSKFSMLYSPQPSAAENTDIDAEEQLQTDVDSIFAPDAEIHLNHTQVDRGQFKEFVQSRRVGTTVEANPEDFIETPVDEGNPDSGSIVAGKLTLVRTHKFRIRVGPAKTTTVISFSAKIKPTPTPQIVQLFQTSVDKGFQVNFPTPHRVDAGAL